MIYTIHGPSGFFSPKGAQANEARFSDLVAVPEDLAKWGLIAPPFWLAFHKLWWLLAAYGLFLVALSAVLTTSLWPIVVCLGGLPGIYLLLEGRQLCRNKLEASGFAMLGVVDATSEDGAIARFAERTLGGNQSQGRALMLPAEMQERWSLKPDPASATPSIGLFAAKEF